MLKQTIDLNFVLADRTQLVATCVLIIACCCTYVPSNGLAAAWTHVLLDRDQQEKILRPAFVDNLVEIELHHAPVQDLDGLRDSLNALIIEPGGFTNAYQDIVVSDADYSVPGTTNTAGRIQVDFFWKRHLSAHAYVRRSTNFGVGLPRMAVLVIPGSGMNQSTAIIQGDALNYHGMVAEQAAKWGDTYVFVKPNEDFLAIHNGTNKLSYDFIYTGFINQGGSYTATYLLQAMAMAKYLKTVYDGLVIVGLSQGGWATLLVSIQAKPRAAIVASGYSILLQEVNWARCNQILLPNIDRWYSKEKIRQGIRESNAQFLFTWGTNESDYYSIEAEIGPTAAYFSELETVTVKVHSGGHVFPLDDVDDFLGTQWRRLKLHAGGLSLSDGEVRVPWRGLEVGRMYSMEISDDLRSWRPEMSFTNFSLEYDYVFPQNRDDRKKFFRLRELDTAILGATYDWVSGVQSDVGE